MFVIRSRVYQLIPNPGIGESLRLQEEGLANPENIEIDAALLPNFMESDTYRFPCLFLFCLGPPPQKKLGVNH